MHLEIVSTPIMSWLPMWQKCPLLGDGWIHHDFSKNHTRNRKIILPNHIKHRTRTNLAAWKSGCSYFAFDGGIYLSLKSWRMTRSTELTTCTPKCGEKWALSTNDFTESSPCRLKRVRIFRKSSRACSACAACITEKESCELLHFLKVCSMQCWFSQKCSTWCTQHQLNHKSPGCIFVH